VDTATLAGKRCDRPRAKGNEACDDVNDKGEDGNIVKQGTGAVAAGLSRRPFWLSISTELPPHARG